MTRTVLLAGATGYIGGHVARELLAAGYRLICPVRDASAPSARQLQDLSRAPHADSDDQPADEQALSSKSGEASPGNDALSLVEVDLTDSAATATALTDVRASAVISCLASRTGSARDSERVEYAANHHLLKWAEKHGVEHFTLLSAICVQKPRLAFQFEKLRFEEELLTSEIASSIVRPTAFFKSLSGQLDRIKAGKPFLVFGQGLLTRCKPIAEADLACYLRLTLEEPALIGVLPVGGPGPALSPKDQADLLTDLTGNRVRLRSVTPRLLMAAARFMDLLAVFSPRFADKAEFARIGHYYATESMLVWDPSAKAYSDEQTPEFGTIRLRDSYAAQLAGEERQDLGDHAMFH